MKAKTLPTWCSANATAVRERFEAMTRYSCAALITLSMASFAAKLAWAQAALPTEYDMPIDMKFARQRMEEALKGAGLPQQNRSSVPQIEVLPRPMAKSPDISQIAESFRKSPAVISAKSADTPELMVFVSLSMPKETLERIVLQSEKSGAVLVLRGLKGNSLTRMGEELAALVGKRNVTAIIHPPAFKQFNVTQVPSLVLAQPAQASKIGDDGCALPASFIKVDGDVTQDYALDLIERQAPSWADAARRYGAKLAGPRL
jgi:conjugal transfer pilus assembly protein TrbC